MDWLLSHSQVFVALIVFVIWIAKAIGGAKKREGQQPPAPLPTNTADPGEAERTRRIQEEIRRRILARQRGEAVGPTPPPVPMPSPPPIVIVEDQASEDAAYGGEGPHVPMPTAAAHHRADVAQQAILEQQRRLAEQLHALRAARAAGASVTPRSPLDLPAGARATISAHELDCRRMLVRDLRHTATVRRAILLKEILGPPLALQPGRLLPRR
jgi:hypothetical protein